MGLKGTTHSAQRNDDCYSDEQSFSWFYIKELQRHSLHALGE